MRVWSERVYGIPPEQIIGSSARTNFELRESGLVLTKTLELLFVDDKEGKPVAIHQFIGRRPIACFGNSDGDKEMAPVSSGKLVEALENVPMRGWVVVDMLTDWNVVWSTGGSNSVSNAKSCIFGKWLAEDIMDGGVLDRFQSTLEISEDGAVSGIRPLIGTAARRLLWPRMLRSGR